MSLLAPMNTSLPASAHHAPTLPESAWLQHRGVLHELYICQNKKLNEVKRTMEELHGFPVMRPHDYEVALREVLGLRKNLKGMDWQAIKFHWDQRQSQGKNSNVLWNGMVVDERKVRKEIHRKRKRSHFVRPRTLPPGVFIETPPPSPTGSIITVAAPIESCQDPRTSIAAESYSLACLGYGTPYRLDVGITFLEPTQMAVSRFQELRKECPFNVFIGQLLDFSDSYHVVDMVPVEYAQAPGPRLLGVNPSWELLARVTFEMSNNTEIDWTDHHSSWFLNWFEISADLRVLRAFFSITGPTVCAVYEKLCSTIKWLRRSTAANVLFEMLDTIRGNNSDVADAINFLEIAVDIGSTSDGMVRIATRAIERHAQVADGSAGREQLWLSSLIAASQGDTEMLRLLVDAGARPISEAEFDADSPFIDLECDLGLKIIHQLTSWSSDEVHAIDQFVQLLIEAEFLSAELSPRCYISGRPEVVLLYGPFNFDEVIMLCPAIKRQEVYKAMMKYSSGSQDFVCHAGIFTSAGGGTGALERYIRSCRQDYPFDTLATMQESLVFAALLNDTETMSALLQAGTDPSVGLLQGNENEYNKGLLPWNPMVIAAMAGSKEALMLLSEWLNINTLLRFLEWVPIYEIVRQINLDIDERGCGGYGTEFQRLDNLRRQLLYESSVNSESVSEIRIKIEASRTNRLELLSWIRSCSADHGLGPKVDEEILKAAFSSKDPYSMRTEYALWTEDHYCDVLLLDGLVDTNLKYHESGMDLLQLSIRSCCSLEVVEFLLGKGFKVHSRPATETKMRCTMLHDALLSRSRDRPHIVNLLLNQGAHFKDTGTNLTLLEASLLHFNRLMGIDQSYPDIFGRLLDEGASVSQRPQRLIQLLIRAGAVDELIFRVLDAVGEAQMHGLSFGTAEFTGLPLVEAISQGRETLARELIRRGADVHMPTSNSCDFTALQAACTSASLDFIKYLVLENGVDVNEVPAKDRMTALQRCKSLSVCEFLLGHGADVNALSGSIEHIPPNLIFRGRAVDVAAKCGRLDMLVYLLKAGGRSGFGGLRGAILLASKHRHFAVSSVLVDWDRKHGSQILEEEAKCQEEAGWQLGHPDAPRFL